MSMATYADILLSIVAKSTSSGMYYTVICSKPGRVVLHSHEMGTSQDASAFASDPERPLSFLKVVHSGQVGHQVRRYR